ncbi:ATP synthase membrane subunit DAPIT, mitochondrial-like [Scaptodrosophila lebanonensis]|uniref:ATP synthase membrane subunit DAPIT, mitochondrial-like n=1 Tax=Drosophila lebanonensis TaxID=7225 RepID=A0A6J2TX49_DROLE|nr:ATP synthase membrane subunit DAPIT, mitochondrial-like [Scaptodrosophila lebanonensis]
MAQGFNKYFNSTTINGRANVAKVTYASIALFFIYLRMRRGSKSAPPPSADDSSCSCEKPEKYVIPMDEQEHECD